MIFLIFDVTRIGKIGKTEVNGLSGIDSKNPRTIGYGGFCCLYSYLKE